MNYYHLLLFYTFPLLLFSACTDLNDDYTVCSQWQESVDNIKSKQLSMKGESNQPRSENTALFLEIEARYNKKLGVINVWSYCYQLLSN